MENLSHEYSPNYFLIYLIYQGCFTLSHIAWMEKNKILIFFYIIKLTFSQKKKKKVGNTIRQTLNRAFLTTELFPTLSYWFCLAHRNSLILYSVVMLLFPPTSLVVLYNMYWTISSFPNLICVPSSQKYKPLAIHL